MSGSRLRAAAPLLLLALALVGCSAPPSGEVRRLHEAELLVWHVADAPPPETPAGPITLPHGWGARPGRSAFDAWVRLRVTLDEAPDAPWSLYLSRVGSNAAVWVNDAPLGSLGRVDRPIDNHWNRPLLFRVPAPLWKAGENVITVRVAQRPFAPFYLSTVRIGPDDALRPAYTQRLWLQVRTTQASAIATLAVALLTLAIYRGRDPSGGARWLVAGLFAWAFGQHGVFGNPLGLPIPWDEFVLLAALAFVPLAFVAATHRMRGLVRPRVEWAMAAASIALGILLLRVDDHLWFRTQVLWQLFSALLATYLVWLLFEATREANWHRRLPLVVAGLAVGAILVRDLRVLLRLGEQDAPLLLGVIPLIVVVGLGWGLVAYLLDGLRESERLNEELEERVREKHDALEQSYAERQRLARGQAVAEERERLMRDMHDGMGGQLVSTLALVESGAAHTELADALRESLVEMRIVIDSLDPNPGDLGEILAMFRARIEPRLRRAGVALRWQVGDLPALPWLGSEQVLDVARILQEATTNVLKHAGADTITLHAESASRDGVAGVAIEVRDDGRGEPGAAPSGRGFANFERRARRLGGAVDFSPTGGGSTLRLWLPATRSASAPDADGDDGAQRE